MLLEAVFSSHLCELLWLLVGFFSVLCVYPKTGGHVYPSKQHVVEGSLK